jgi:cytochrome c-type biogenesis protein CcmH/NrfF
VGPISRLGRRAGGILLAAAALAFLAAPAHAVKKSAEQEITDGIICPCSCGEILTGCTCDTAKEMKAFIANSLQEGKSKAQITQALVAQYGEVVLGAPKAKGFNLVVWVAPILVTLLGFAVAFFLLRRWTGRGPSPASSAAPGSAGSAAHDLDLLRARAEDELRRLRR